jgi:hypothetical protein
VQRTEALIGFQSGFACQKQRKYKPACALTGLQPIFKRAATDHRHRSSATKSPPPKRRAQNNVTSIIAISHRDRGRIQKKKPSLLSLPRPEAGRVS